MHAKTLTYSYRPRPFATDTRLELGRKELVAWQADQKYVYPYHAIDTVRLFFAPKGVDFSGFRAKIYSRDGKTIAVQDRSFKSLAQVERQGPAYRAFMVALCRRVEAENPRVLLHAGRNPILLALTGLAGAGMTGILGFMGFRTFVQGSWLLALAILGFSAMFGAWSWRYVTRNRPRRFIADAVPEAVLPPA